MKLISTIMVLILALLGVAAMLYVNRHDAARRANQPHERRVLAPGQLPVDDITRIRLKRAGQPGMVFERDGTRWNQIEPFAWPMDPFSIRQLAILAVELEAMDSIAPANLRGGQTPATLWLKPPAAEVSFEWAGKSLALQLGRRSVAGRAFLSIAGDETIFIVDQKLHERAVDMDAKEWRDRTIFQNVGVESGRIEWSNGPAQRLVLARERKQWKMLEPAQTRVDPANRDSYFQDLARAAVGGFILDQPMAEELQKFGLADAAVSLIIAAPVREQAGAAPESGAAAAVQRLRVGARVGGGTQDRFGMIEGRPVVVRLPGAVLAQMFRMPEDLAARTGSGTAPADIKSIVIRTQSEELKLERDLEQWRAPGHANTIVNAALVQELLDQLTQLRAGSLEFVTEYPRNLEYATITLHGFDGHALDTVRIVHDEKDGRWGLENGDNVLRIFPASLKMRLTAGDFGLN